MPLGQTERRGPYGTNARSQQPSGSRQRGIRGCQEDELPHREPTVKTVYIKRIRWAWMIYVYGDEEPKNQLEMELNRVTCG